MDGARRQSLSTSVWIVDGHNAIFRVGVWSALQTRGEKRAARLALEEELERFARAVGRAVWVVYDGNEIERNPDLVRRPHLQSHYSNPPEEADDRIRHLAAQVLRDRGRPAVVSSDRRFTSTLGSGIRVFSVEQFFRDVVAATLAPPEKWTPGAEGDDDLWRHFLSASPHESDRRLAEGLGSSGGSEPEEPSG